MNAQQQALLDDALAAWDAGLSVITPREDGSKSPNAPGGWKQYRNRRLSREEVKARYRSGHYTGLGIVTGPVFKPGSVTEHSDDVIECLEFDDAETEQAFFAQAEADPILAPIVQKLRNGYRERTPSGGTHYLYRTPVREGNVKLACRRLLSPDGSTHSATVKTLIETRADGGYLIVAPSHGGVHPSGQPYELLAGGFDQLPTLTAEERSLLFDHARSFDERPPRRQPGCRRDRRTKKSGAPSAPPRAARRSSSTPLYGQLPGDDFNSRAEWSEILEPHGCLASRDIGG
jgi:hypothetical protein